MQARAVAELAYVYRIGQQAECRNHATNGPGCTVCPLSNLLNRQGAQDHRQYADM